MPDREKKSVFKILVQEASSFIISAVCCNKDLSEIQEKVKVKLTLHKAMKAERGSRCIALVFL